MAELNIGGVIKAALSLNCNERYADGTEKHEMAGKILFYFDKEEAAESIVIPIIYETGAYVRNGNITIHRDGRCSYEFEKTDKYVTIRYIKGKKKGEIDTICKASLQGYLEAGIAEVYEADWL